jgi:hypothetical protein
MYRITKEGKSYPNEIGTVCVTNYLPYIGKVVAVYEKEGKTFTTYEPASPSEARDRTQRVLAHLPMSDKEKALCDIRQIILDRYQEDWYNGLLDTEKHYCDGCRKEQIAHGSARIDQYHLCYICLLDVEEYMFKNACTDIHSWMKIQDIRHHNIEESRKRGF